MISLWWEILKNAKLSGRAKGTTLSSNRIKIKKPEDDCIKRMKDMLETTSVSFIEGADIISSDSFQMASAEFKKRIYKFIEDAGESTICKILQFADSYDLQAGFKEYLDMGQKELKRETEGNNKWRANSINMKDIDDYAVNIFLTAGKVDSYPEVDIKFICTISNSNEQLYFNTLSVMKLNPNTLYGLKMLTNNDWRKR